MAKKKVKSIKVYVNGKCFKPKNLQRWKMAYIYN